MTRAPWQSGLIHVMARRGYDGASIAEIARAAELAPGLVHYHFKSKQEILLVALDRLVAEHEERLESHLANSPEAPLAQLCAFIDLHLGTGATADPDAVACWILLGGEALRQPEVEVRYRAAMERLAGRLRALLEEARVHADPAEAAAAILAAIQGYLVLARVAREVVPRGSAARAVKGMAEGLLGVRLPAGSSG